MLFLLWDSDNLMFIFWLLICVFYLGFNLYGFSMFKLYSVFNLFVFWFSGFDSNISNIIFFSVIMMCWFFWLYSNGIVFKNKNNFFFLQVIYFIVYWFYMWVIL